MMKIPAAGAISKLGIRLRDRRRRSSDGEDPALTQDDEQNIEKFEKLVVETNALLDRENDALSKGDVSKVAEFFQTKQNLLKSLELRQPVVEPFLRKKVPEIDSLRGQVRALSENLQRNGELLEGMAQASTSIVSEVERLRRRQGLEGLYDKSGQLRTDVMIEGRRIQKNL
jgi:hypothetical protein